MSWDSIQREHEDFISGWGSGSDDGSDWWIVVPVALLMAIGLAAATVQKGQSIPDSVIYTDPHFEAGP